MGHNKKSGGDHPEKIKNTAKNKIRRIERELKKAGGNQKQTLLERLMFWKQKI